MVLIIHITIACVSILQSTYALFRPSRLQLRTSYSLVFLTLATGSALMVLNPAHLTKTCYTGLAYLAFVGIEIFAAKYRLSKIN